MDDQGRALSRALEVGRTQAGANGAAGNRQGSLAYISLAAIALFVLGLFATASASAAPFEVVGHFAGSATPVAEEEFEEEVQLGGVGGMAVNYTGAGGAEPGTVYAATKLSGEVQVAMFVPEPGEAGKDGSLAFSSAWEVTLSEETYKRCGPGLPSPTKCPIRANGLPGKVDVDVDQKTGNVYVYNGASNSGNKALVVYNADGSSVISRFGVIAVEGKTTAETPDQIHSSLYPGGIAVNGAGEVYVFDLNTPDGFYHRLMKFRPKTPGNFAEFVYAGTSEDVGAGFTGEGHFPMAPVMDAAGNIYVAAEEESIEMYDAADLDGPPICRFEFDKGGITAMTVDPLSGEVFFATYKRETGFKLKLIHQLGPCDKGTGEFEETGRFEVNPERDDLWGLTFDPVRKLSPARGEGVLYGGAPGTGPSSGVGKGEAGQSSLGYIFAQPEENPPTVESESVSLVKATSAQLQADINPQGHETSYVFQYLSEEAFQGEGESFAKAAEAPLGGAKLDSSGAVQSAGVTIAGLAPDTVYVYRVLAKSECAPAEPGKICEGAGAAQSFRTYPAKVEALPDGRAYELVSPAEKHGGQVFPADPRIDSCGEVDCKPGALAQHFPMQSTPGGDAIVYEGTGFAPGEGAVFENQHRAVRTDSGWQSTNLTPSLLQSGEGQGYKVFDVELRRGVLEQLGPPLNPAAPPEFNNLYFQSTADPLTLKPWLNEEPPGRPALGPGRFRISYGGAAADLSQVFFAANDALTEETSVAPAAEDGGSSESNLYEWEPASGQLRLVNVLPGNTETKAGAAFGLGSAHSISADGSRAFWTASGGQLYVRENAETTRAIPGPGKFLAASTDGSMVLLDNGCLYDLGAEACDDLTDGNGGFTGLVGQSDDLSRIYFIDAAVLDAVPNGEGDVAEAGENNLYSWSGGQSRYVATLADGDNGGGTNNLAASWKASPSARTAEASPNGRFVTFLSQAQLTGYDNIGPCESDHAGGFVDAPCPEAFLFDSATEGLICASCNPSGAQPLGPTVLRLIAGPPYLPQPRYLTNNGRLYFDSQDSLSPFDTNEGVEDVYQFEQENIGGCKRDGGCVSLISAGREGVDSNLLAVDGSGKNVFFTSRDRLLPADKDQLIDLYVAREGGGFSPKSEPPPSKPPLQAPPPDPTPASPGLTDSGNVAPTKGCKKGQVRKKGKCVKKHKAKKGKKKNGGSK